MQRRHSLDLRNVTPGQFRSPRHAYDDVHQRNNMAVRDEIRRAAGVAPCPLGNLDIFVLAQRDSTSLKCRGIEGLRLDLQPLPQPAQDRFGRPAEASAVPRDGGTIPCIEKD